MSQSVRLVSVTPDAEKTIGYIARVSNPANQENEDVSKLLQYCIRHGHWSVFEQATLTLEINTSLAVAMQILRHRSFCFQMFSARYQDVSTMDGGMFMPINLRRQDTKNRQSSHDDLPEATRQHYLNRIARLQVLTEELYSDMIKDGIAKECARMILPQATRTRLYMTGNVRSWIHYFQQRLDHGAQREHQEIAEKAHAIFCELFPTVSQAITLSTQR